MKNILDINDSINIDYETLLDFINLSTGVFSPLNGFMDSGDFRSMVQGMTLKDGSVFTVPIIFPISILQSKKLLSASVVKILYEGKEIGYIEIEDIYETQKKDFFEIFKTGSMSHPGLKKSLSKPKMCIGGKCVLTDTSLIARFEMITPQKTKKIFQENGWETTIGFHTRNVIHRGHEHLQRIGLELCDGLFINPLMGWKKKGDFTEEAIKTAYSIMVKEFYPEGRVYFHGLRVSTRYAGPREAVFTAIIRRNLGCTHFIMGRDHSGVGEFYDKYDSQKLVQDLQKKHNLGIQILLLSTAYYCRKCKEMVSERSCSHKEEDITFISGTEIREKLMNKITPPEYMMRPEIAGEIMKLDNIFI